MKQSGLVLCLLLATLLLSVSSSVLAQDSGEVLLYQEGFDDGQAQGWELESGWGVIQDGDNWVLAGEGHHWARPNFGYAGDFRIQFRLRLVRGGIHLVCRLNDAGRYFVGFHEGGSYLSKQYWPDTFLGGLAAADASHVLDVWHEIEIVGQGASLRFLVDGELEWEYTDSDPLLRGSFAFETLDETLVYVDDIFIYGPAPTPTPTPDARFTWVRTGGPLGGLGYDVRMRPDNPDVMYVTDAWAGVFMSTDGGESWFPSNEGITTRAGESGDAVPVFCLTIDPHDYDTIWVGTQNVRGIFRSTDGGRTWIEMDNGVVEREGITFRGFAVDPRSSDIVYAAAELSSWVWAGEPRNGREFDMTGGVVYKTADGGQNWTAVWRGDNLARYVWIDPRDPDVVYVSTGIFDREAANSVPSSATPGGEGVLKSTDGGQTWVNINNGLTNAYIGTLFMQPENPDVLLAGAGNNQYYHGEGVYLSTDGGASWQHTLTQENINAVEFAPSDPAIAYAGSAGAVYRSQDGGRTWQRVSGGDEHGWGPPGVRAGFPIDFQVDPRDPNRIFANNYGGGNFVSSDGGRTWKVASRGYTGAQVRDIAVDPVAPGRVYAAARSGIFVSDDGGGEWAGLNYAPAASLEWYVVAIDPTDPSTGLGAGSRHVLAANNWNGVIMQSHDGGQKWRLVSRRPDESMSWRAIVFAPSDPTMVYAGTSAFYSAGTFDDRMSAGGIYVSHDGGSTWREANDAASQDANVTALAVDLGNPQIVYAATGNHGLLKTADGGGSWMIINEGLPGEPAALSVAVHPSEPGVVFAGLAHAGLYRSADGGTTWQPASAGLNPESKVSDIIFDPADAQVMYLADCFSGVYRSTDGGATWVSVNVGLRTRAVNALAISSDGGHLYAATEGEGVYRLDLSGQPPETAPGATPTPMAATPTPQAPAALPGAPAYLSAPWVYVGGPLGGLGYDVRMDPRNPDVMFVTDAWAGVFKSVDGGETWFPTNSGITTRVGPSGDGIPVFSLTIDPNNPDRVWIGTQFSRSVFRSDDGGTTWTPMNNGILETAPTIRGFTVEPGNSDVVYLAGEVSSWEWHGEPLVGVVRGLDVTKGIVYKTIDGGRNWTRLWYGDNLARYVWIHPDNHDLLYVSTGIFDREAANSNPDTRDPGGVGILRSHDGGATWEVLNEANGLNPDELYFGSLFMHPGNPDILLAAAGNDPYTWYLGRPVGGIYLTEDGGDFWIEVLDGHAFSAVEFCEGDPNVAYAAAVDGFYRSDDTGHTWQQLGGSHWWGPPDVVAGFPIDLQCDPRDSMRIFVNAYGGGNFLSEDGGQSWQVASKGYTGALMRQVAVAQDDPARVYASARSGVFASRDGGENWYGLSYGVARAMEARALAVDPQDSLHVLATVEDAGPNPKLSRDGGQTWRDVGRELWGPDQPQRVEGTTTRIVFAPSDPQVVLATVGNAKCLSFVDVTQGMCERMGGSGVIMSRDGGETWAKTGLSTGHVVALAISPHRDARVYAAVFDRSIYRSDDGGETWELVNQNPLAGFEQPPAEPDAPRPAVWALAVDPANPDKVYAGFVAAGVAISHDGGLTWEPSSAGMPPEASVPALAVDPTNPDVVYAGAAGSGVYVSTDGGQTWQALNDGLLTRAVKDLALSADGSVLYMASEGGGVHRLGTPPESPQPEPTSTPIPVRPTPTPVEEPSPTTAVAAPTSTSPPSQPTATPEAAPTATPEPSKGGRLCGGAVALPLALVGLASLRRQGG